MFMLGAGKALYLLKHVDLRSATYHADDEFRARVRVKESLGVLPVLATSGMGFLVVQNRGAGKIG